MRSAMSMKHDAPYVAIIGTVSKPTIAETSVAYATFYHQLIEDCIDKGILSRLKQE